MFLFLVRMETLRDLEGMTSERMVQGLPRWLLGEFQFMIKLIIFLCTVMILLSSLRVSDEDTLFPKYSVLKFFQNQTSFK